MPGIVGILSSDQLSLEGERSFPAMCESLRHTAAQRISQFRYKNLLVGKVDLGTIRTNISPRETDDVIAFIWGELINPQAERRELLRDTWNGRGNIDDLDLLIGLFAQGKERFIECARGSFNAFVFDKRTRALNIVNDRFGFRPLYYHLADGELVFASEVKAILKYRRFRKEINPAGLADFFHFGFVTGEKTFFHGIELVPPSSACHFQDRRFEIRKYWNLQFTEREPGNRQEEVDHAQRLATALQQCVKDNTEGGFRFGLPLSGGLDSRTIAACIPRDRYPIPAYTWGTPASREVRIARKVAQALGMEHHNLHRTPGEFVENFEKAVMMTDGMIPANLPLGNFLYERSFAQCADICLDGMQSICAVHPIRSKPLGPEKTIGQMTLTLPPAVLKTIFAEPHAHRFLELAALSRRQLKESIRTLHPIDGYQFIDVTQKQRRLDNIGVIVKRNFVEVRSPLFDYPVIDIVAQIPPTLRAQRYIYHKAFTQISPELAKITNIATLTPVSSPHFLQMAGRITKGLKSQIFCKWLDRAGICFDRHQLSDWGIDYGSWYNESAAIKSYVRRVLGTDQLKNCEYLNANGVQQVVDAISAGKRNDAETINRLMTYAIWTRMYL